MLQVFSWYYGFSQVGAISHAREDNKTIFKVIWLLCYAMGWTLTIYFLWELIIDIQKYEVNTLITIEEKPLLPFPAVTICSKNRMHCQHFFDLIRECETEVGNCKRRDIYCNLYLTIDCNSATIKRTNGTVCTGCKCQVGNAF